MAATVPEFGQAVEAALAWLGHSPETAGPLVGIKVPTLSAMCQGIVPMRSLVIRFAEEIARRANGASDHPDWWTDVDAWLALAGLPPRRDHPPRSADPHVAHLHRPAVACSAPPAPSDPADETAPASACYRPECERLPHDGTFIHVFWLRDRNGQRVFCFRLPPGVDYRDRAARLKRELASLSRREFDQKYARYRVRPHGKR